MRALWLQDGTITVRDDIDVPQPAADELLLAVELAGICGTDLELLAGYAAFSGVPGHEFVGRVVDGPSSWQGRRVVAEINVSCGRCPMCQRGYRKHCEARSVVGIRHHAGAFAEYVTVPVSNCHPLPDALADEAAVLVEPLAAALEILESLAINADTRVLIVGAGRLAVLIAQVIGARTTNLEVLVRRPQRRPAFEGAGIRCVDTPDQGYDVVVEVSGNPAGFDVALAAVRPRGTLVMKSTYASRLTIDASRIVVDEIRIVGSRCGPFDQAIDWLAQGRVALAHLNFERFDLDDFETAFERARDPAVYKVLLAPATR